MAPQSVAREPLRVGLRSHLLMECPAPAWPRGAALSDAGVLWVVHAHGKALGARPAGGVRAAALFKRKGDAAYLRAFSPASQVTSSRWRQPLAGRAAGLCPSRVLWGSNSLIFFWQVDVPHSWLFLTEASGSITNMTFVTCRKRPFLTPPPPPPTPLPLHSRAPCWIRTGGRISVSVST